MIRGIILAGGSGKRLWPLSREKKPKQLLNFFSEKTFLEESISRLSPITDSIHISTGEALVPEIKKILPKANLIVEPERRDTAGAIGLCAANFEENDILIFTPSDAFISPAEEFHMTIKKAISVAEKENSIVVIGIKPRDASTSYGYLETSGEGRVVSFKEKPSKEIAEQYIKKGYFWNAGIFVCKTGVMLELFKKHEPEIFSLFMQIKSGGNLKEIYSKIKKISFDYAVMEKAEKVFFVPATFYWNDVGLFSSISEIIKTKNAVISGEVLEMNSSGNIISVPKNKKVALIDCEDLVVIDTLDALLVCKKSSSAKVKQLVEGQVSKEMQ